MNLDQIVNMVMRIFMRKAINKGINAGVKRMGGKSADTQRARKALRVSRKIGRM